MRTILVTGANGFIGRHVCRAAALGGDRVIGVGLGEWAGETWRDWGLSDWRELEVTTANLAASSPTPDVVVHCAGGASVPFSIEHPAEDFRSTVITTLEVLEYLRTCAPNAALVYPSSGAVYGRATATPIGEESGLAPISPYGFHKMITEDLCRSYGQSFGIRTAIVRIFSAYGTELRKQLLWDACRKADLQASAAHFLSHRRDDVVFSDLALLELSDPHLIHAFCFQQAHIFITDDVALGKQLLAASAEDRR